MYKKILIALVLVLALGASFFAVRNTSHIKETSAPLSRNASTTGETIPETVVSTPSSYTETSETPVAHPQKTQYEIPILSDGTVLDAMRAYAETSNFVFSGETFAGLGFFVNDIGDIKNKDGYYWTLFIDGKVSELGASSVHVLPGARVEWRYQKGL